MDERERMHFANREAFALFSQAIQGARVERRHGYWLIAIPAIPIPPFNAVWAEDESAADGLADAVAELDSLGVPSSVQLRAGLTPRVEAEARRLGYTEQDVEPGMVATPAGFRPPEPPELEVERVSGAQGLEAALELASSGFEVPGELLAPLYGDATLELPGYTLLVGRVDGEPVSTAAGFTLDGAVGIFGVATAGEHRRRGYGAALTAQAVSEAFAAGADFAYLQSSPLGESVYRALGFRQVETYINLARP